jgi:glycosyltransferase involved in cell wall biosynthesis
MGEQTTRGGILFFTGWPLTNLGGVSEVLRNLVREFDKSRDFKPIVVECVDVPLPEQRRDGDAPIRMSLRSPYVRSRPIRGLLAYLFHLPSSIYRLIVLCRENHAQVLNPHFVGLEYFTLALLRRSRLFRGKLLFSFHGSDLRAMLGLSGLEKGLARFLLRSADLLVPCSSDLGSELLLLVPDCRDRIFVVPNGIDVERFVASADPGFELPEVFDKRRKIVSVAAFEYKKAPEVLLRAFAALRSNYPGICLVMAGQRGGELENTRAIIAQLRLEEDVLLLVDIPHRFVSALLRKAEVCVLSSRWERGVCGEGFAMALLEAAAACKPVVSTRSCGVDELIPDSRYGLVVPTEASDQIAESIAFFLDHPEEASRSARNLQVRVQQNFTWHAAAGRYRFAFQKT